MNRNSFCILFFTFFAFTLLITSCGKNESRRKQHIPETVVDTFVSTELNTRINVYIENSGSMYGYVKGQTEFEQIVYNFLVNIGLANVSDNLNLYYINSRILPQNDDIRDFVEKLEPNTFKAKGGNMVTSDIANMVDDIISEMNDSIISIFVSDCIFSPGSGKDAEDYLNNQKIGIKKSVGTYFNNHPQFAIIGYQCLSTFKGNYYDKNDRPQQYDGKRPFFIWVFGSHERLNRMLNQMSSENFKLTGNINEYVAFAAGEELPEDKYAIKPNSGNFKFDKNDTKHSITNLVKMHNGKAQFSVNVNFEHLLLNDSYLCDKSMYSINDSKINLESIERINSNSRYTHTLRFSTEHPHPSMLEIKLLANTPTWVEAYNDEKGGQLNDDNKYKTFGLKYMVNGFTEAIVRKDYYTTFKININKQ